ncbi:hypothetical protein [Actinosynnema sp. NPDC020468]|uniref:hypothetical protein n=1 Tax=Actinosynnema sp. NPDC020468 TaxID=3154488 RepID=UPI0033F21533
MAITTVTAVLAQPFGTTDAEPVLSGTADATGTTGAAGGAAGVGVANAVGAAGGVGAVGAAGGAGSSALRGSGIRTGPVLVHNLDAERCLRKRRRST